MPTDPRTVISRHITLDRGINMRRQLDPDTYKRLKTQSTARHAPGFDEPLDIFEGSAKLPQDLIHQKA